MGKLCEYNGVHGDLSAINHQNTGNNCSASRANERWSIVCNGHPFNNEFARFWHIQGDWMTPRKIKFHAPRTEPSHLRVPHATR